MRLMVMLAMLMMIAAIGCSRLDMERSVKLKDKQEGSATADVQSARQAYVVGHGYGELKIKITSADKKTDRDVSCNFYTTGTDICVLWSKSELDYDSKENAKVVIDFKRYEFDESTEFNFKLYSGDFIDVSARERTHMFLNDVESLNVLVDFKDIDVSKFKRESTKVQYVTLLPYGNQMDTTHALSMYLRKGTTRATPKNVLVSDNAKVGVGLIKTLVHSDPDFCLNIDCKVAVRFDAINVNFLDFFVMVKDKDTEVSMDYGNTFIEELTTDDQVTYVIEDTLAANTSNWKFILMPLKGNPDMSVNFDTKPANLQDYRWKTSDDKPEEIFITKKQLQELNIKGSKVYLTFNSTETTQFIFKILTSVTETASHLRPNMPVMGEANAGEIVNYIYSTHAGHPETIAAYAKLTTMSGNPDLYIKDCSLLSESEQCAVTQADIDNWADLESQENRVAMKSTQKKGDDSLYLRFNCLPIGEQYQKYTFEGDESELFTTNQCVFAVAVVGRTSAVHSTSKYVLEFKGSKHHEMIELNKPILISQGPNNSLYFKLHIDKVDPKHKFLTFKFLVNSGDMQVLSSRIASFPDKSNADHTEKITTTIGQGVSQFEHFMTIEGDSDSLVGDHYLTITPSSYVLASVVAFTSVTDAKTYHDQRYQELTFGQGIIDTIEVVKNASNSYYFSLKVPPGYENETEVTLELKPIKGQFTFCISAKTTKIDDERDCTWSDYNNDGTIVFNARDPAFKSDFDYGVLVKPNYHQSMYGEVYSFSLLLSSQEDYTPLQVGVSYNTGQITSTHSFFQVAVDRDAEYVAVLVVSEDVNAELQVSNDSEDFSSSSPSSFHKVSTGKKAGVVYQLKDIQTVCDVYKRYHGATPNLCNIYLRLTPSKSKQYDYTIITVSDNYPIYVLEGETINLPSPVAKQLQVLYYPTSATKGSTINVYHPQYPMTVGVRYIASNTTSGETIDEKTYVTSDSPTGVIRLSEDLFKLEANRGVEISIINTGLHYGKDSSRDGPVDVENLIQLQINSGLTRVTDNYPVYNSQGKAGMFDYFLYTKRRGSSAFIYLRVDSGEADLYISKSGRKNDRYPDIDTFDYSSSSIKNDEIMLPPSTTKAANEDKEESYIIGVYNVRSSSYSLQTGTDPMFKYMQISAGQVIKRSISPDSPLLMSFMNNDLEPFKIAVMGQNGPVSVFWKANDENKVYDFRDMVPTMDSKKTTLRTEASYVIKKQKLTPNKDNVAKKQWSIVVKPDQYDEVTFFIEKGNAPLMVPIGHGFYDLLGEDTCQSYEFKYETDVFDEYLNIKLEQGSIKVIITEQDPATSVSNTKVTTYTMQSNGEVVTKKIQLSTILGGKDEDVSTPDVFNKYYVRICSQKLVALYQLKALKPSSRYYRLTPSERINIDLKANNVVYYYKVDPSTVKSIGMKIATKPNSAHPEYVTSTDQLLSALQFYYVSNGEFGEKSNSFNGMNDPKYLTQANIKSINSRGVHSNLISLDVQDGYLLIKAISKPAAAHILKAQLIVNDYVLLPSTGRSFEYLQANKEYIFQVTKAVEAQTSVDISSCSGKVEVKVYNEEQTKPINSFTIGRTNSELDPQKSGFMQMMKALTTPAHLSLNTNSSVFYIHVKTTEEDATVAFKINTRVDQSLPDIDSYFFEYNSGIARTFLHPYTIQDNHDSVNLTIKAIKPAEGFEQRFKNFERAQIEYRVHIAKANNMMSKDVMTWLNLCSLEQADLRTDTVVEVVTQDLTATNGRINWPKEPFKMNNLKLPTSTERPLVGLIQIKIACFGDDDDSNEDDTVVLVKHEFTISAEEPSFQPKKAAGAMLLITLILGAIICAAVFWIKKQKIQPDRPGFSQARTGHEMNRLELDSVATEGSKIENTKIEGQDSDETV